MNRISGLGLLAILMFGLSLASLMAGPVALSAAQIWQGLWTGESGPGLILRELRLPRTLLALTIGFFLGLSGAVCQGWLRNPLAEPSVFGAPQAAAFGAVIVLYFGWAGPFSYALPIAAMAGAGFSAALVIGASRHDSGMALILAGLGIGALAGAGVSLALSLSPNPFAVTEIVFWLLGSLEDRSFAHVWLALPFLVPACLVLLACARPLQALSLGEETALSLGISLEGWRIALILAIAAGTGAAVSVSGTIGFIGLAAPHLARAAFGPDPGRLLMPSALIGSVLLLMADIAVRLIPSLTEVRIGVLTALIGVPFFLAIALKGPRP